MPRVEFRLSMPNRSTWDGRWSGDGRNHTLVRELDAAQAEQLDGRSWSYSWPDGWRAEVTARRVPDGATVRRSDGFCGYDWMVASILRHDRIYADHEVPKTPPQTAQG